MKSRSLVIGVLALLGVAGGAFVGVNMLEKKVEQQIRDTLALVSVSVEGVEYSLLNNNLEMSNLALNADLDGTHWQGTLERVSIQGFDSSCLDKDAEALPRVAETLLMQNMAWTTTIQVPEGTVPEKTDDQLKVSASIAELHMEDYRQNLGKLFALAQSELWSEAFWAEAYRYHIAMATYKNYEVTLLIPGNPKPIKESIGMMGLLGPDTGVRVQDGTFDPSGLRFSVFANDVRIVMPDIAQVDFSRMEMHDIVFPAPARMAEFMTLQKTMESAQSPDEQEQAAQALLSCLAQAYASNAPFGRMLFQNFAISSPLDTLSPFKIDELNMTMRMGTPVQFGLHVQGFQSPVDKDTLLHFAPVFAFLPQAESEGIHTNFGVDFSVQPESAGLSRMDLSSNAFGLAHTEVGVDFLLGVESFGELLEKLPHFTRLAKLSSATLNYKDNGLTAALLTWYGMETGQSAAELQQEALALLPDLSLMLGMHGEDLNNALRIMLEQPGSLDMSLKLSEAAPAEHVPLLLLLDPQNQEFSVKAEAGPKPFAAWLPAAVQE